MSIHEKDPRDIAYVALYIAAKWYKEIEPEQAWRIATGKSTAKPESKLTPELKEKIMQHISGIGFHSFDAIEKKFKVSRYKIIESEEKYTMGQIEIHMKKLKDLTQTCNGECELCSLDIEIDPDGLTMCEFLSEYEPRSSRKPKNSRVHKSATKCTSEILTGAVKKRGFGIYKNVLDKFTVYTEANKDKKINDIVSAALYEYMQRHR